MIYDGFKVTSRLRTVFQGIVGPFWFSASKHRSVVDLGEWQKDGEVDFQNWGVCPLSVSVHLSPNSWFKGPFFPPGNLKVSKQCPGLFREFLSACMEGPWNRRMSMLLLIIQGRKTFQPLTPALHGLHGLVTFWLFCFSSTRKLGVGWGEKKTPKSNGVFVWILNFWQSGNF